jgi:hypothetical protein
MTAALEVQQLPRRVALAVHALMEVRNDPNLGPYGPFKASEIVLYDGEALNARSTAAALREATKYGLVVYIGHGLWTATHFALNHCSDFETRYLADTAQDGDA